MLKYPKIATIKFKNKQVDCKLVLRAKIIEMDLFYHDAHEEHKYMEKVFDGQVMELRCPLQYKGATRRDLTNQSLTIFNSNEKNECPVCKSKLFPGTKQQVKIYSTCNNRAIDAAYILNRTQFTFKLRRGLYGTHNYTAFASDYETMMKKLMEPLMEYPDKKKNKDKVEIILAKPFPTKEQMIDCLEEYKSWKVAREL